MCLVKRSPESRKYKWVHSMYGIPHNSPEGPTIKKIQSRSKISISIEIFNLARKFQSRRVEFPTKTRAAVGGSLENVILARNFQSRSKSRIFLIFGPSGSPLSLILFPRMVRFEFCELIFAAETLAETPQMSCWTDSVSDYNHSYSSRRRLAVVSVRVAVSLSCHSTTVTVNNSPQRLSSMSSHVGYKNDLFSVSWSDLLIVIFYS